MKQTQYEKVSLAAVSLFSNGLRDPRKCWEYSAEKICQSESSQEKSCPRSAFLGLAEQGLIKNIPSGKYLKRRSNNKLYAINAVNALKRDNTLTKNKAELWKFATDGYEVKNHNSQMDVVLALWENYIVR